MNLKKKEKEYQLDWLGEKFSDGIISITDLVEKDSLRIKKQYINIIESLGNKIIYNKSIINYLKIDETFSLWWMSLIYEKNIYKSPQIQDCLKVIALRNFIIKNKVEKIKIFNAPRKYKKSIINLLNRLKVSNSILYKKRTFNPHHDLLKNLKNISPLFIRSLHTILRYLFLSNKLKKIKLHYNTKKRKQVLIVSYFLNYNYNKLSKGYFNSEYWGKLPQLIKKHNYHINWLHMTTSNEISFKSISKHINKINKKNNEEYHYFLETFFTYKIFFKSIIKFLRIIHSSIFLYSRKDIFLFDDDKIDLWPILKKDWKNSISGPVLMMNIIYFYLFQKISAFLTHQSANFYLHEGQGWEKAFISAQKLENNYLIGVIQSPMRFWDLKLYDKDKNLKKDKIYKLPFPNKLAVNTFNGYKMAIESNLPKKNMICVEPLRYDMNNFFRKKRLKKKNLNKVIILGGYLEDLTNKMINVINSFINENKESGVNFYFKEHPGYKIKKSQLLSIKKFTKTRATNNLFSNYDCSIIAGDSSVTIDSFLNGCETIIFLDSDEINFNPLRNNRSVHFVKNKDQLASALRQLYDQNYKNNSIDLNHSEEKKQIYFMNKNLNFWREFLDKILKKNYI